MGDAANTFIPAGAEVFRAVPGTTAPTDIAGAWGAGWASLGLLGEDGLILGRESDTNDLFALGPTASVFVRRTEDKQSRNWQFTLVEDTDYVFKVVNPGSTSSTTSGITTRVHKARTYVSLALGIQFADGATIKRFTIPTGQVTDVGETSYAGGQLTGTQVTYYIVPASDGTFMYEITNLAGAVAP